MEIEKGERMAWMTGAKESGYEIIQTMNDVRYQRRRGAIDKEHG